MEVHFNVQEGDIDSDLLSNGPWPPAVGEHLAIKYCFDQIEIGEFVGKIVMITSTLLIRTVYYQPDLKLKLYPVYLA